MARVNNQVLELDRRQAEGLAREQGPSKMQQTTGFINWTNAFTVLGQPGSDLDLPFSKLFEMRRDPMIRFGLQYIKVPLIRAPWYIKCEDAQVAAFCDSALRAIYGSLILAFTNALDFGFSPIEKRFSLESPTWTYEDPSRNDKTVRVWDAGPIKALVLKPPIALPPDNCWPRWTTQGEFDGFTWSRRRNIMNGFQTRQTDDDYIDVNHALWATNESDTVFGSLWGYPRIAYAHRYWWSFWFRWALNDRAFEKHADPALQIYYPDELTQVDGDAAPMDTRAMAMVMGEAIRSGSTVTMPNTMMRGDDGKLGSMREWEVKPLEIDAKFADFQASFEYLDIAKLRSLMIPEKSLIEAQGGGGYNVASEMGDLFYESQAVLMSEIDDQINRFILPQLVAANFPDRKVSVEKVTRGFAAQDMALAKQLVQLVGQQDATLLGMDTREILRQAGVPQLSAEKVAKQQQEAAKAAAGQGAPQTGWPAGVQVAQPGGNPMAQGGNPQEQLNADPTGATTSGGFGFSVTHPNTYADVIDGRYIARRPVINLSHPLKDKFKDSRLDDDTVQAIAEALHDAWAEAYRDGYEAFAAALEADGVALAEDPKKPKKAAAAASVASQADLDAQADQIVEKYAPFIMKVYAGAGAKTVEEIGGVVDRAAKRELVSAHIDPVVWNMDNPDVVEWMGSHGAALVKTVGETTIKELKAFIAGELKKTQSPKDIANAIRAHFADFPGWKALRLARTESAHAYNEATILAGKAAGVKWVQAMDASNGRNLKTDKPCIHRHGKFYRIEDAPYEDFHPNGTLAWRLLPPGLVPPEGEVMTPAQVKKGALAFYDQTEHSVHFAEGIDRESRDRFLAELAIHLGAGVDD